MSLPLWASSTVREQDARSKACAAPFVLVAPKRNTPAGARRNPDRSALSASPIPPTPESHVGTAFAQRMHERRVPPVSHPGGLFYHAIDAMRQMPGVWGGGPKKEDEKAWGQASIYAFAHSRSEGARVPCVSHPRSGVRWSSFSRCHAIGRKRKMPGSGAKPPGSIPRTGKRNARRAAVTQGAE